MVKSPDLDIYSRIVVENKLISHLSQIDKYSVIERRDLPAIITEREFQEYYSDVKDQDEDAKQWVEVYDSGAEDFYYWNNVTGDVQWTQPHNYILAADDNSNFASKASKHGMLSAAGDALQILPPIVPKF